MKKHYTVRAIERFEEMKKKFKINPMDSFGWEQLFLLEEEIKDCKTEHVKTRQSLLDMYFRLKRELKQPKTKENKERYRVLVCFDSECQFENGLVMWERILGDRVESVSESCITTSDNVTVNFATVQSLRGKRFDEFVNQSKLSCEDELIRDTLLFNRGIVNKDIK